MTVWVVTEDGYRHSWGSELYLIGVYDDKETAESIVKNLKYGTIHEITLNATYQLKDDGFGDMSNQYYLGGYAE